MSDHLVRTAHEAFLHKDYSQALQLYREAGERLGHNRFSAQRHLCQNLFYRVQAALADQELRSSEFADAEKRIKYADRFRVAFIADEFTTNSFSDEFIAIPLEPADWREKIDQHQPEIFFCESAWSGPDSKRRPWKGKIYASRNFSRENRTALLEILAHCRQKGIPTLFWNKEDPTHFADRVHDFVKTAKEFDCVFTSAAECVQGYQREHGVSRAFALPFATNPRLFNPMESGHRSSRVVFAGSWYANHVQRSKDMEHILDAVCADGYELEIYDRYHGDPDPLHVWPDRYQRFLKPSQPHDRMPSVYKSGRYGLNFNTVTDSSTMFARRVFELMSSNTLVISNYSRGTDEMLGDLVVYPDKQPERLRALRDADVDALRERALDKVLRDHTYKQRWLQVLQSIGVAHKARNFTITATCLVGQQADAREAIAWFQQHGQQQPGGRLLLVADAHMADLEVAELYRQLNRAGVSVTSCSHATRYAILDRYQPVETSHFLAFHPRNAPPAGWLSRAALHLQYATEYPLTVANDAQQRYRTGLASPDAGLAGNAHARYLRQPDHAHASGERHRQPRQHPGVRPVMAHPFHHAESSAKKYGGEPHEYLKLHQWLDGSKSHMADFRHRALRHHSEGIFMLEEIFGTTLTLSTGRVLPVRFIGEQHVLEDLGRIPTVQDWLGKIQPESWMLGRGKALAE